MSKEIKNEFKEFISTLSTEICREVLLEELKKVNNSFNQTSNIYKTISNSYIESINSIKEQLIQLQATNKKLNEFTTSTNINNEKIKKALEVIDGSHKKVIDNILSDNKKIFELYSKNIQAINEKERNTFISALVKSLNTESQKYISELKNIVNGSKIEGISKSVELVFKKVDSLEKTLNDTKKDIKVSEDNIIDELGTKIHIIDNKIAEQINQVNNKISNMSDLMDNKIENISVELSKKNSIIIVLISIVLVLSAVIVYIK